MFKSIFAFLSILTLLTTSAFAKPLSPTIQAKAIQTLNSAYGFDVKKKVGFYPSVGEVFDAQFDTEVASKKLTPEIFVVANTANGEISYIDWPKGEKPTTKNRLTREQATGKASNFIRFLYPKRTWRHIATYFHDMGDMGRWWVVDFNEFKDEFSLPATLKLALNPFTGAVVNLSSSELNTRVTIPNIKEHISEEQAIQYAQNAAQQKDPTKKWHSAAAGLYVAAGESDEPVIDSYGPNKSAGLYLSYTFKKQQLIWVVLLSDENIKLVQPYFNYGKHAYHLMILDAKTGELAWQETNNPKPPIPTKKIPK